MKEPDYFMTAVEPPRFPKDDCMGNLEQYQKLYRKAAGYKAIGDGSTGYLWDRNAPKWIHEVCPHARIVVLLRDPIERAYSQYIMWAKDGTERSTFAEAVRRDNSTLIKTRNWNESGPWMIVELGMYFEQVLRFFETFGREQVGIYLYEDLVKDTQGVMSAICRHIGVDPALLDLRELERTHNVGRVSRFKWLYWRARRTFPQARQKILPRFVNDWLRNSTLLYEKNPPRDEDATRYLQSIFEPDLCRLEELLGQKLPELRKSWI